MTGYIIAAVAAVVILGVLVFPMINKAQFKRLPFDQKVRILMKEAKGLVYFKNISEGTKGTLIYVKNKRKIYTFPWVLKDGAMLCTRKPLFEKWDYPEEMPEFSEEEKEQAINELNKYNQKNRIKILIDYDAKR